MARFAAVLLAALLTAGRLTHAAPSTAEVFWHAVLPSSAVPDAVLRLLRPDTSFESKARAESAGPALDYQDYNKRSSATPASDHNAVTARDSGDHDHSKGSSKRLAAIRAGEQRPFLYNHEGEQRFFWYHHEGEQSPFWYHYEGEGKRQDAAAGEPAADYGRPGADTVGEAPAPFRYSYKAPSERHAVSTARGGGVATTTVFFQEEAVRVGKRLPFYFPATVPAALGFLPRHVADSIPFSTPALPGVLALFGVSPESAEAAGMRETLRTCEFPPLAGEAKFCATSLEALVERAMAALGTRDVRAVTSTLPGAGAPLQLYTVRTVRPVDGASFVACHDEAYPYTVYRCHSTGPARAYMVDMDGARGGAVTVATVCHTDTSRWNPEHVSFKLLGTKPGGAPICHLMPYGHIIWAKNGKRSPA